MSQRPERPGKRPGRGADGGLRPAPRFEPERRVVAVSGARSFVGAETLKRLEEDRRYAKILAVDIRKPDFPLDRTQFYKVDLTLPTADADLADLLAREDVDTFVHAAFLSSPTHAAAWAHELEDIGTMHVLNACAEARVRKVLVSSTTMVYGAALGIPTSSARTPRCAPSRRRRSSKTRSAPSGRCVASRTRTRTRS